MNAEIDSDGRTVWVNDESGCCIGRFCRNGIDIHHSGDVQVKVGQQCLDCKKGPCDRTDWEHFKRGMSEHFGVTVSDIHRPKYLNHPVPAIPIEIDYSDADMGYIDVFTGIEPCHHVAYRAGKEPRVYG